MYGGQHEEALEKHAEKKGKLGEVLLTKPDLSGAQAALWGVFWVLHSARQVGFELHQYLQITDIMAYASTLPEDPKDVVEIITEMDRIWYEWYLNQRKQQSK